MKTETIVRETVILEMSLAEAKQIHDRLFYHSDPKVIAFVTELERVVPR